MMTHFSRFVALALALLMATLAVVWHPAPVAAQQRAEGTRAVLFAVARYEDQPAHIDPIAIVERGRYLAPPADGDGEATSAAARRFIADYYRAGRQLRLLFGGAPAGTLTVREYIQPACVSMTASAQLQTSVRVGGMVQALATDSAALGGQRNSRRAPTEAERTSMLELARSRYRQRGVAAAALRAIETINLTAVDLNGDGNWEMIGSFSVGNLANSTPEHMLFLIAEPQGQRLRPSHVWYHRTPVNDEAEAQRQLLVDHLDLDGDGQSEIITQISYYESHDYHIYKKQGSAWRRIYTGGGGGC